MGNEIFGIEEKNEEKAEVKELKVVRKPYVVWKVGDAEYKLKLTTSAIVSLEDKYQKNLLLVVSEEGLPPLAVILTVIQASMTKFQHGIKATDVMDIYDEYVEYGGDITTIMTDVLYPLMTNAGFFTEEQETEIVQEIKPSL